jgi:hypothetical protein
VGLLSCRFPEIAQPLDLAREFKDKSAPIVLEIDESEVYSAKVAKLESLLDANGQNKEDFQPLLSMKRLADEYGPQYRLVLRIDQEPVMQGAINRRTLSLTWNDPVPDWVLKRVLLFAKGISADVEAEDDAGNPIDIQSVAQACA